MSEEIEVADEKVIGQFLSQCAGLQGAQEARDALARLSTPSPATLVEALGEALFGLSAKMVGADFLKDDANHAAYERVVHAFQALQATEPRP